MYKIHALTPLNKDYPAFNGFDGITISEVNDLSLVILMKRLEPQKDFYTALLKLGYHLEFLASLAYTLTIWNLTFYLTLTFLLALH